MPQNFITFSSWIGAESKNIEAVFTAEFDTTLSGNSEELYVKIYPQSTKGLMNEITGWLINKSLNLPQPKNAYIALIDIAKLPKEGASESAKALLLELEKDNIKQFYCFATSTVFGKPAGVKLLNSTIPPGVAEMIIKDVREWSFLNYAIVGDEKMANTDRHLNNLLRIGKNKYSLIDNGRLFCDSTTWTTSNLANPLANLTNKLSDFILEKPVQQKTKDKIMDIAERKIPDQNAIQEIYDWCDIVIADENEKVAFKNFISVRVSRIKDIIAQRYNLLV